MSEKYYKTYILNKSIIIRKFLKSLVIHKDCLTTDCSCSYDDNVGLRF